MGARDSMGLTAADEGDLGGLHTWVDFLSRETKTLGMFGDFPKEIADRLMTIAREAERAAEFIDGYRSAPALKIEKP